jgi:hypothetical protein
MEGMEKEITIEDVRTFQTKGGNTRFVVRDENGEEYTTFREQIGDAAKASSGERARIRFHTEQRGQYTNVYLDQVDPLGSKSPADSEDTEPEEAAWRTAVDAAPWLAGASDEDDETPPDELFEKLKPFKDRVSEDIRETREANDDAS